MEIQLVVESSNITLSINTDLFDPHNKHVFFWYSRHHQSIKKNKLCYYKYKELFKKIFLKKSRSVQYHWVMTIPSIKLTLSKLLKYSTRPTKTDQKYCQHQLDLANTERYEWATDNTHCRCSLGIRDSILLLHSRLAISEIYFPYAR